MSQLLSDFFITLPLTVAREGPTARNEEIAPRQRFRPRETLKRASITIYFVAFAALKTRLHGGGVEVKMTMADCASCKHALALSQSLTSGFRISDIRCKFCHRPRPGK